MGVRRTCTSLAAPPGPGAYNLPELDKTSVKFDRSTRFISKSIEQPGPGSYSVSTRALQRQPIAVIGSSKRETVQTNGSTPGPGTYNPNNRASAKGCALGGKAQASPRAPGPGPADYSPRHVRTRSAVTVMGSTRRERDYSTKVPGPGTYTSLQPQHEKGWKFGRSDRNIKPKVTGPGPGHYETQTSVGNVPAYAKRGA